MKRLILVATILTLALLSAEKAKVQNKAQIQTSPIKSTNPVVPTLLQAAAGPSENTAPVSVPSTDENVGSVRELSSHVLLTAQQRAELEELLRNPELQSHVRSVLSSPKWLTEKDLSRRAAVLDVLYEGLKAKDLGLSAQYFDLAEQIVSADMPSEIAQNPEAKNQFEGDRVELALVARQISPDQFQRLKIRAQAVSPRSRSIFAKAETLKNIYKVSL